MIMKWNKLEKIIERTDKVNPAIAIPFYIFLLTILWIYGLMELVWMIWEGEV